MPVTTDPLLGDIRFLDAFVPALRDGSFTIVANQSLSGVPGASPLPQAQQSFTVAGPRFTLDPTEIHSQFPPPNHAGQFEECLPHIVLNAPTLPWERYLDAVQQDPAAPWMALMLFNAGSGALATAAVAANGGLSGLQVQAAGSGYDIAPAVLINGGDGTGATALATINAGGQVTGFVLTNPGTGYSQTNPPVVSLGSATQSVLQTCAQVLSPGNDANGHPILAPSITLDPHESPTDLCRVIDVATTAFAAGKPQYKQGGSNELSYMAHGRQVAMASKEVSGPDEADGLYSVLVGKRFPRAEGQGSAQTPGVVIAHLVSLEGYARYLDGTPSFGSSGLLRLVSLASWTFTCQPEAAESFSDLMNQLVQTEGDTSYLLTLPYAPPPAAGGNSAALTQAQAALDLGFVPLSYQTRQGEYTFAWYRGPLLPAPSNPIPDDPPLGSSTQALIYDPTWGVFDQSLAVAFETARLLALSDKTFSVNLLNWRREGQELVNLLVERLPSTDAAALAGVDAAQARALLEAKLVSTQFMQAMATDFAQQIAPNLTGARAQRAWPPVHSEPAAADSPIADLKALLANPDIHALLVDLSGYDASSGTFTNPVLENLCEWLAHLALLYGIPFRNLVPTSQLLPKGSIRFFYIDQNSVNAMIDGAMSVAAQTGRDTLYYAIMRDVIRDAVGSLIHQVRYGILGQPAPTPPAPDGPICGFLLRSAVVSGWPGLEVKAFAGTDSSTPIPLLRMDRLASDLLLCLFPSVPQWIQIDEPSEGIAFGVEDLTQGSSSLQSPVYLRHIVGSSTGVQMGNTLAVDAAPFTAANGVVNLAGLKAAMEANASVQAELASKQPPASTLSAGEFALQMVKLPERMTFVFKP